MESDTGHSLKVDRLDPDLGPSSTAPPVVMIQYRDRGVPLWILIPLVIIVPLSAILVYHRLVVVRYRTQAALARQALDSQIDGGQTVVRPAVEIKPSEPLALNSQPIAPGAATLTSAPLPLSTVPPVNVAGTPAPSVTTAGNAPTPPIGASTPTSTQAAPKNSDPESTNPVMAQPNTGPVAGLMSTPIADENTGKGAGKAARTPGRSITVLKPAEGVGEPASEIQAESGNDEVVDVKAAPLPTKEESLRQIEEEAAKKQADIDGLEESKLAEFRAIRQSERIKFRDELRELLQTFGNRAGPEIDKLAKQNGYDINHERFLRARHAWKFTRMSMESKVRFTRSLDLPEAAILNFLSDELHLQVGSREGPRNRNEVRIRAARLLLNFPLPTTDATASPIPSDRADSGVASTKLPQSATSGRSVSPRSR